jgi:hypothetical protein
LGLRCGLPDARLARYPNLEVFAIFRIFGYFLKFLPFNRRYIASSIFFEVFAIF